MADQIATAIDIERGIVNYDYWMLRCQIEPNDDTLEARKLVYDADQAFAAAQITAAADLYMAGFKKWRQVLDAYPKLLDDSNLTDELSEAVERYRRVMNQLEGDLPKPFLLQDVLDSYYRLRGTQAPVEGEGAAEKDKAEAQAAEPTRPQP